MQPIKVSAPATVMIAGEHAVLQGSDAIAMALNKRLTINLTRRDDDQYHFESSLGNHQSTFEALPFQGKWHWISRLIKHFHPACPSGMTFRIDSDINPNQGLGSSAALLIATYSALYCAIHRAMPSPQHTLSDCLSILKEAQGYASGTDLAASLYGGVIDFNPNTLEVTPLAKTLPHHLVYSGHKEKTADVIAWLKNKHDNNQTFHLNAIAELVPSIASSIAQNDFSQFAHAIHQHQDHMTQLGLNTPAISDILTCCNHDGHPAKISGSGLGDCVIIFTEKTAAFPRNENQRRMGCLSIPSQCSTMGVLDEST